MRCSFIIRLRKCRTTFDFFNFVEQPDLMQTLALNKKGKPEKGSYKEQNIMKCGVLSLIGQFVECQCWLTGSPQVRLMEVVVMLWSEWGEQLEMTQYSWVDLPADTELAWPLQRPQTAGQTRNTHTAAWAPVRKSSFLFELRATTVHEGRLFWYLYLMEASEKWT